MWSPWILADKRINVIHAIVILMHICKKSIGNKNGYIWKKYKSGRGPKIGQLAEFVALMLLIFLSCKKVIQLFYNLYLYSEKRP